MQSIWWFGLSIFYIIVCVRGVTVRNGTIGYDPAELLSKMFQPNVTVESRQRGYGFIKFEDQSDHDQDLDYRDFGQYGLINGGRDQRPLKFEDDYHGPQYSDPSRPLKFQDTEDYLASNNGGVTFQDDNKVEDPVNKKRKKRRRRRKPKNGVLPYPGVGASGRPGLNGLRPYDVGYGLHPYVNPSYPGIIPNRRPRRPRPQPSLATTALSSITSALSSIALYDDYQCVPRLLCEAAGGGSLSNNGVLQSVAGIQPLLTLLSVYNGISTSPLFVFGRAVFLGMTSKGNTGTCRYAYPQCPTDPEELIYYLNNHNGGFFRFFSSPQLPNQNVDQFYHQLGSQGYGFYQPGQFPTQGYGYPSDPNSDQYYGLYQHHEQFSGQNPQRPYNRPSLYNNQDYNSNYAYGYRDYDSGNQIRFKDTNSHIQKRIQNKPDILNNFDTNIYDDYDIKTKWQFPEEHNTNTNKYNTRDIRTLKFPDENQASTLPKDSTRNGKQIYFQNKKYHDNYYSDQEHVFSNNNRYQTSTYAYNNVYSNQNYHTGRPPVYTTSYNYNSPPKYYNYIPSTNNAHHNQQSYNNYYNDKQSMYDNNQKYKPTTVFNNEEYVFDHKHNFYVKKENKNYLNYSNNSNKNNHNSYNRYSYNENNNYYDANNNNFKRNEEDGLKTVYVVRGNGDPKKPEIIKLRPGQSVY